MVTEPTYLQQIDTLQAQIQAHEPWDEAARRKIAHKLRLDWNYHSQSIEGGTLTARETRTIMLGSLEVQGKPLKDVLEMQRHDEVIQEIMQVGRGEKRLSESRIRDIHAAIMYEADPQRRALLGQWKTSANEIINPQGEKFLFTAPDEVPDAIHDLLNRTNANWDKLKAGKQDALHAALMAFDFHLEYLTIHPFYDGNGRSARILLNLILIAFGYPPVIVKTRDKDQYGKLLAEIQGYGASRDLYYAFMAGLLLRTQALVLSALRGEEIEEEDDLMKEIGLFVKTEKGLSGDRQTVSYHPDMLRQLFSERLLPFLSTYRTKTAVFDELFERRQDELEVHAIADIDELENTSVNLLYKALALAGSLSLRLPLGPEGLPIDKVLDFVSKKPREISLQLKWEHYLPNPEAPFSLKQVVQFILKDTRLELRHRTEPISPFGEEDMEDLTTSGSLLDQPYTRVLHGGLDAAGLTQALLRALFETIKHTKEAYQDEHA